MSYKDIDARYVDGILDVMRKEFQVNSNIPKKLEYHPPRDYTRVEKKQLSKKVREFRLTSEDDLKHLEEAAAYFKRKIISVSN